MCDNSVLKELEFAYCTDDEFNRMYECESGIELSVFHMNIRSHLSGTTRVGRYQKKHSPTHTHPGQRTSYITFVHLQRSTASSLFSLRA